jgi:Fe2+ or Zn2+ uptake regulation protein
MSDEKEVAAIAETIIRYFKTHPHAVDSVEGITRWWLTRQRFLETLDSVERALEYLVTVGVVKKMLSADGQALYSLSGDRDSKTRESKTDCIKG